MIGSVLIQAVRDLLMVGSVSESIGSEPVDDRLSIGINRFGTR